MKPVPQNIQKAINRFNMTTAQIVKAQYEKENPGVPFSQWLAMKWNSRNKNVANPADYALAATVKNYHL